MKCYVLFNNIKVDGGYKPDYSRFENYIENWIAITKSDKKQLFGEIEQLKQRDLTFAWGYGAFVKKDCGHWEFLQLPHAEDVMSELSGNCTRCICGYWDLLKGKNA